MIYVTHMFIKAFTQSLRLWQRLAAALVVKIRFIVKLYQITQNEPKAFFN